MSFPKRIVRARARAGTDAGVMFDHESHDETFERVELRDECITELFRVIRLQADSFGRFPLKFLKDPA